MSQDFAALRVPVAVPRPLWHHKDQVTSRIDCSVPPRLFSVADCSLLRLVPCDALEKQVRKLWCDYSEAKGGIESPFSSSTTSAESREGDDYDAGASAFPPSLSSSSAGSIAAGQGPARALRAFVDAVDLTDARQAAVLQNLVSLDSRVTVNQDASYHWYMVCRI